MRKSCDTPASICVRWRICRCMRSRIVMNASAAWRISTAPSTLKNGTGAALCRSCRPPPPGGAATLPGCEETPWRLPAVPATTLPSTSQKCRLSSCRAVCAASRQPARHPVAEPRSGRRHCRCGDAIREVDPPLHRLDQLVLGGATPVATGKCRRPVCKREIEIGQCRGAFEQAGGFAGKSASFSASISKPISPATPVESRHDTAAQ